MLFERLNTGARQLSDQELRNCVYHGIYNDFLKRIAENQDFKFCLNLSSGKEKRMQDVELVLRFFTFLHNNFVDFKPPMKKAMNDEMIEYSEISEDELKKLEEQFKKSVSLARTIWGKRVFRRFSKGDEDNKNGHFQ